MTPEEKQSLIEDITTAVRGTSVLTEDEHRWVKLAIQKEAQAIAFRKAVIEKSMMGLVWAAIIFLGNVLYQWAIAHGFKP